MRTVHLLRLLAQRCLIFFLSLVVPCFSNETRVPLLCCWATKDRQLERAKRFGGLVKRKRLLLGRQRAGVQGDSRARAALR